MKKYKIELKWSIIFVVVALLWMVFEKMLGLHGKFIDMHASFTNFFAIPAIAVYVFALREKKYRFYEGEMSYKQAFISGLIITGVVTILSPLTQTITSNVISPEYFTNAIRYAVESGNMEREAAEAVFNLNVYILMATVGALFMGLITTAIVFDFYEVKTKREFTV